MIEHEAHSLAITGQAAGAVEESGNQVTHVSIEHVRQYGSFKVSP